MEEGQIPLLIDHRKTFAPIARFEIVVVAEDIVSIVAVVPGSAIHTPILAPGEFAAITVVLVQMLWLGPAMAVYMLC